MEWLIGETPVVPLRGAVSNMASDKALLVVCDQNEADWYEARNGLITGSAASRIVSPTGKARAGKAVDQFAYELAFDRVYGRDLERYVSRAMELGHIIEPESRAAWAAKHDVDVTRVGFVYGDASKRYGCSPDGLFVRDGALGVWETKARQRAAMCEILAAGLNHNISPAHHTNLQFNMWICGATVGVYVEYYSSSVKPLMVEITVGVDADLFDGFELAVPAFCKAVDHAEERLRCM